MAILTGTVSPLLVEGIRKLVGDAFKRYPLEFSQWMNMNTSKKNYEFDREVTTVGALAAKTEGSPIVLFDPRVGRQKTYTHSSYAGGVRVSWEAEMDELYGFIRRAMGSLGKAANETMNVQVADTFNLCDSGDTGFIAGFDTLALLHDAHTGPDGEALAYADNRLSADLSESVLQTALIQFEKVKDAQGNRVMVGKPSKLLIAPDNMFLVKEILQSEGKPFTADNTTNVLKGIITPVVGHYFTDADRWIILAQDHDMNFFMRTAPVMDSYDDKSTKSMVNTLATRFSYGFGDFRGAIGSIGA